MRQLCVSLLCVVFLTSVNSAVAEVDDRPLLVFSGIENSGNTVVGERVMREAYRRIGYRIRIDYYSASRALTVSSSGEVDGELGRIRGIDRVYENLVMVDTPMNRMEAMVFSIRHNFTVNGWPSLSPYVIGIQLGVKYAEQRTAAMQRVLANNNDQLIGLLIAGRVDLILMTRTSSMLALKDHPDVDLNRLEPPVDQYELFHYLHKKNEHLKPLINQALQQMEQEGVIEKIRQDYLEELKNVKWL